MLVELIGHNDAAEYINPEHVRRITAGTTMGTTHIYLAGDAEPIVVQGFRHDVARLFKRDPA